MGSEHGRCWNKFFLHVYYREKACILCKVSWPVLIQTYIYYGSLFVCFVCRIEISQITVPPTALWCTVGKALDK